MNLADRERKRYLNCLKEVGKNTKEGNLLALAYELLPRLDCAAVNGDSSRTNYDVYRSAASRLFSSLDNSMLLNLACSALGLNEWAEKVNVYIARVNEYARSMYQYRDMCAVWDRHALTAAKAVGEEDTQCSALYASLKTWEDDKSLDGFYMNLADYVSLRTEIWIIAPFELLLSISEEGFSVLVRRFLLPNMRDEGRTGDVLKTVTDVRTLVKNAYDTGILHDLKTIACEADKLYIDKFAKAERGLRMIVPTLDAKRRYCMYVEERVIA